MIDRIKSESPASNPLEKYENLAGKCVLRLVIGTSGVAALKTEDGQFVANRVKDAEEIEVLTHAFKRGFNFIDTARMYGDSEVVVGEAVRLFGRDSLVVATKVAATPTSADETRRQIEGSVERLGFEPDILFVHNRWDGYMGEEMDKCIDTLVKAKAEGLCKAVGVSNFRPAELVRAIKISERQVSVFQARVNLVNPRPDSLALVRICRENGITFMASSALDRGKIEQGLDSRSLQRLALQSGMSIYQLGIYALLAERIIPILQSHNKKHIDHNIDTFGFTLKDVDRRVLSSFLFR